MTRKFDHRFQYVLIPNPLVTQFVNQLLAQALVPECISSQDFLIYPEVSKQLKPSYGKQYLFRLR
jgi:hypothetical protein